MDDEKNMNSTAN